MKKHNLNAQNIVNISSYTSESKPYICPADGYAVVDARGSSSHSEINYRADDNSTGLAITTYCPSGMSMSFNSLFVRKGTRLVASGSGTHAEYFYELV